MEAVKGKIQIISSIYTAFALELSLWLNFGTDI